MPQNEDNSDALFPVTRLVKVKDWVFNRYKIKFLTEENGKALIEDELICSDSHIESEVLERWPNDSCTYWESELLEENVKGLRFAPGPIAGTRVIGAGWKSRNWN